MNIPSTQRSPGDHFKIIVGDQDGSDEYYVTSITKAKTWATESRKEGFTAKIVGITPYGKHKMDTCEQGCRYCASGVGKGGRESKEVKRAIVKSSYSNTQTVKVIELEVGDIVLNGIARLKDYLGDNTCKPRYATWKPGRVFVVEYIKGSRKGKLGEVHFPIDGKVTVVR